MQTIYETSTNLIEKSILGIRLTHKPTKQVVGLTEESAELFMSVFTDNLEMTPPRAVDSAMDELCGYYFPVPKVATPINQPTFNAVYA